MDPRSSSTIRLDQPGYYEEKLSGVSAIIPAGMKHKVALAKVDLLDCNLSIGCSSGGVIFAASSFVDCDVPPYLSSAGA